jgi:hypothetical protein
MRRVNTGYALRFNRRHERAGYLFQNRFGSKRVTDDGYLRTLIPYILRNPLHAGIVRDLRELERFRWCSYGATLGRRRSLAFEDIEGALNLFGDSRGTARRGLRRAMAATGEEVPAPTGGASMSRPKAPADRAPTDSQIAAMARAVCDHLDVFLRDVEFGSQHERACRARAVVAYAAVRGWQLRPSRVAAFTGVSTSAVSHAVKRGEGIVGADGSLREVIQRFVTVPAPVVPASATSFLAQG